MIHFLKSKVIWFLLMAMLCVSLAGCGDKEIGPDGTDTDPSVSESIATESVGGDSESDTEAVAEENTVELAAVVDGKKVSRYAFVRSFSGSYDEEARTLYNVFKSYTGMDDVTYVDDIEDRPEGVNLILIGNDLDPVKYPEMAELSREWGMFDYGLAKVDETLIVYADNVQTMADAIAVAKEQITQKSKWIEGRLLMEMDGDLRQTDDRFLADFPRFKEQADHHYYNNDFEIGYEYKNVTRAQYDAYIAELATAGYVDKQGGNQIGRNLFATCIHPEKGQLHLTYFPLANKDSGELTVFATAHVGTVAIPEDSYTPDQKITEAVFHVMSQDYTNRGKEIYDGNGMCYVMTLKDGRYVIFDGGYDNNDPINLYNYMKAMNKRADGKIVIAAWFMSHSHGDHVLAFEKFMSMPSLYENVNIEYFVANSPTRQKLGEFDWMTKKMPTLLERGNIPLIKPHTGQIFSFGGTKFEILLSQEATMSNDVNDMSTVVRIEENGHTILLSADAMTPASGRMVSLYGEALKSDVLQVNHHGHSGGTVALFEKVAPTYALWTTSQEGFDGRINGGTNTWIRDNVGIENCYVADDEIEQIFLPENGEIYVVTETGYRVTNNYPKENGDGVLKLPPTN